MCPTAKIDGCTRLVNIAMMISDVSPHPWHQSFSCLHLRHWPMAYLMTLSDCLMSCQARPPCALYGQLARCKHGRPAVYFLYKMACFNGVYRQSGAAANFGAHRQIWGPNVNIRIIYILTHEYSLTGFE